LIFDRVEHKLLQDGRAERVIAVVVILGNAEVNAILKSNDAGSVV
jgi:hypothetical protein